MNSDIKNNDTLVSSSKMGSKSISKVGSALGPWSTQSATRRSQTGSATIRLKDAKRRSQYKFYIMYALITLLSMVALILVGHTIYKSINKKSVGPTGNNGSASSIKTPASEEDSTPDDKPGQLVSITDKGAGIHGGDIARASMEKKHGTVGKKGPKEKRLLTPSKVVKTLGVLALTALAGCLVRKWVVDGSPVTESTGLPKTGETGAVGANADGSTEKKRAIRWIQYPVMVDPSEYVIDPNLPDPIVMMAAQHLPATLNVGQYSPDRTRPSPNPTTDDTSHSSENVKEMNPTTMDPNLRTTGMGETTGATVSRSATDSPTPYWPASTDASTTGSTLWSTPDVTTQKPTDAPKTTLSPHQAAVKSSCVDARNYLGGIQVWQKLASVEREPGEEPPAPNMLKKGEHEEAETLAIDIYESGPGWPKDKIGRTMERCPEYRVSGEGRTKLFHDEWPAFIAEAAKPFNAMNFEAIHKMLQDSVVPRGGEVHEMGEAIEPEIQNATAPRCSLKVARLYGELQNKAAWHRQWGDNPCDMRGPAIKRFVIFYNRRKSDSSASGNNFE